MGEQNTCIRCGKPCQPSEVMCPECADWIGQQAPGAEEDQTVMSPAEPAPANEPEMQPEKEKIHVDVEEFLIPEEELPKVEEDVMADKITCRHCSAAIPAISRFCSYCGGDQLSEQGPAGKKAAATQAQKQAQKVNEKKTISKAAITLSIVVFLLAMLLVAGVVMLLMEMKGDDGTIGDASQSENGAYGSFEPEGGIVIPEKEEHVQPEKPEPEDVKPEEPAKVACRKCGEAIAADATVCPLCEWDQTKDPAEEPEVLPAEATLGSKSDLDERSQPLTYSGTNESSSISQSGSHNNSAAAAADGKFETSWQEGVDGYGIGQWISFDLGGTRNVQAICLWLGNWREGNWYSENGVPKAVKLYVGEETFTVEFPYGRTEQWVILSTPVPAEQVKLEVTDAYAGSKYADTCIAEVKVYGWAD